MGEGAGRSRGRVGTWEAGSGPRDRGFRTQRRTRVPGTHAVSWVLVGSP